MTRARRDVRDRLALAAAAWLPQRAHRLLRRGAARDDGLEADFANVLWLTERLGWPALERLPLAEARREFQREQRLLAVRRPRVGAVAAVSVGGAEHPLAARLYVPRGAPSRGPLLLYVHGGGWVLGCAADSDALCRFVARQAAIRVLTVSYRLAPEAPFPAALDDIHAALRWVHGEAGDLGADRRRIVIGGDSAGANLATVVAREAPAALAGQLLFYPVTDLSREHRSYATADGPVLTAVQMRWFRGHYLTRERDALDPRASPLLAEDLVGLPPAYLAVAAHDPLRDEGLSYAARLREAGVPVALAFHARLAHAFVDLAATVASARAAVHDACRWLSGL